VIVGIACIIVGSVLVMQSTTSRIAWPLLIGGIVLILR
jgi:hypothetical protein